MMIWKLTLVVLVLAIQADSCEAFISASSIAEAIGNAIKNFFIGAFKFVLNTIKKILLWIFNKIKDFVTDLFTNLLASIAIAEKVISSRANETLSGIFDTNSVAANFIMKTIYTGNLPDEYYLRPVDLKSEQKHLISTIHWVKTGALVLIGMLLLVNAIIFIIAIIYCVLRTEQKRLNEEEIQVRRKVKKATYDPKLKEKENEAIKKERDLFVQDVALRN